MSRMVPVGVLQGLRDREKELTQALAACLGVLETLQANMPLDGVAQPIMAQGRTGVAITQARAVLARRTQ